MSGFGGNRTVRGAAASIIGVILAGGVAACTYEDDAGSHQSTAVSVRAAPTAAAKDPGVLGVDAANYAVLHQRLDTATGPVVLSDAGPADGPSVGFRKAATVRTAGPHVVTAACVGIPHAQIYISQNTESGTEHTVLEVDCSGTRSQMVQLRSGYVSAQLTRSDPTGAWTGAVAGIKITSR